MDILVDPDSIRQCGRVYCWSSDDWVTQVPEARYVDTAAFGDDRIGRMISAFHTRVHDRRLDYLIEVGECADDVGRALMAVAAAYDDVEASHIDQIRTVASEVGHVGVFW